VSGLDVEAAGGITRAARLTEQEALRVEAEDLTARYGVTVYPARRRGQDGLTTEVDGVSVTGGVDEVRTWLKRHARCKAPAGEAAGPGASPAGQDARVPEGYCDWCKRPLSKCQCTERPPQDQATAPGPGAAAGR
jgi:hypothetical protein